MSTHSYLNKTIFETFQTLGYGDRIWPDVESENWQVLENKILAMNIENYLIKRGSFTSSVINPSLSEVYISMNGSDPSFEGSINGNYYKIESTMTWSLNTFGDGTFYLYLKEVTGATDPTDELSLTKEVRTTPYSGSDLKTRIIMATVTVLSGVLTINENPEGQPTANSFFAHVLDTTNPHGSTLTQTNIITEDVQAGLLDTTSLLAGSADIQELTIKGSSVYQETVYEYTVTGSTTVELNLDTILAITNSLVLYVGISYTCLCPVPVWTSYHDSGNNYFTLHNTNTDPISMRLFIKYQT
jgi:hypothetical protein